MVRSAPKRRFDRAFSSVRVWGRRRGGGEVWRARLGDGEREPGAGRLVAVGEAGAEEVAPPVVEVASGRTTALAIVLG